MEIFVNDQKLEFTLENEKIFKEIWEQLMQFFIKENIAVIGIKIDGEDVESNKIKAFLDKDIKDIARVELLAVGYQDLIKHTLNVVPQFKKILDESLSDLVRYIEEDEEQKLLETTEHFIINLNKLSKMVSNVKKITALSNLENKNQLLKTFGEFISKIETIVSSLNEPIKNNDIVYLKDYIYYELTEQFPAFLELLDGLKF